VLDSELSSRDLIKTASKVYLIGIVVVREEREVSSGRSGGMRRHGIGRRRGAQREEETAFYLD